MLFSPKNLSVCSYWYDRPLSGRQFLDQAKMFLDLLRNTFPELSSVKVVRDPKESTGVIERDFSNFDQEVVASLPNDWVYINDDPKDKRFSNSCFPAISFRSSFILGSSDTVESLSVQFNIGGKGASVDSVLIHMALDFESESIARKLLDISVSFWTPHHSIVNRSEVDVALRQPIGDIRIGWLTYFSDASVLDHIHSDNLAEKFKAGALVQVGDKPASLSDGDNVERLRVAVKELEHTGLLMNPKKKIK
jgi:hypothetical protein